MIETILFALWFFLPAGLANAAPVIAAKLPYLSRWSAPMDLAKEYRGHRVFGSHKTWRGLLSGVVVAVIAVWLQQQVASGYQLAFLNEKDDYLSNSAVLLGALFGAGALMGDALESFIKRQFGMAPGKTWLPFDQIDYIIGGCIAVSVVVRLSLFDYMTILTVWFILHIAFSYLGYLLKLKSTPV